LVPKIVNLGMNLKLTNRDLLGLSAIIIAGCAAFFSVTGLGVLFNSTAVMIMASGLEFAKIVLAAYLKKNWAQIEKVLRSYLVIATILLMLLTSMGIFGYLSNSFQSQSLKLEQADRKETLIKDKININNSEINRYNTQVSNITTIRNSQENNYSKLIEKDKFTGRLSNQINVADNQIKLYSKKIDSLNNSNLVLYQYIDSLKNTNIDLEKEVGGFRFVAQSFNIPLKKAVKWFILLIVFVFDPLAIALIIAYNKSNLVEDIVIAENNNSFEEEQKRGRPKKKL
jgi:hypothetical protein